MRFLLGDRPGVERELVAAQEVYRLRDDEIYAGFHAFRSRLTDRLWRLGW